LQNRLLSQAKSWRAINCFQILHGRLTILVCRCEDIPGGMCRGWGTLASAITLDPRGRSRFRDCNFEVAGRAAAPREGASVTGHAVQLRRMRRRATVAAALSAVVPRRPDTRRLTGAIADAAAPHLDQDQDALALSLPHVVRRPRSALCPKCREPMKLVTTILIFVFYCSRCRAP
jgi:hypothetical protein